MNPGFEIFKRFAVNWFRTRFFKNKSVLPLILSYFVTFRCNLRCGYCDYAGSTFREKYPELSTDGAIRLLEICREGSPSLAISGGEPLLRDDITEIVKAAQRLNYKPIALFTNSLLLPEREEILDYVDLLQISLDTTEEPAQEAHTDHRGVARTVKENIRKYARLQQRKNFKINVNCVVSEDHIDDVRGVLDFARANRVRFTLAPKLVSERPDAALVGNTQYEELLRGIMTRKRRDYTIMDTYAYLSCIRSFSPFKCYPWLTPRVYPNGTLLYPCPVPYYSTYDVLERGSWRRLEDAILKDHEVNVDCKKRCFLPCYLEASTLLSDTVASLKELRRLL